jgi:AraC-like DNA-binding protein
MEYIHNNVIDLTRKKISNYDKSISEIAYELGYKYPQHFTRFFKQKVGVSPNEYKVAN